MTTAEHFRSSVTHRPSEITVISVAGVPWPAYKLLALVVGVLIALAVVVVTGTPAPAVLGGAAAATAVWLIAGLLHRR
jgi:hypothetical protein